MAQNKITDKDKRDILRFAHIFKDHPEIYKDYYNQLLAGNPNPKLNDDLIRRSLNLSESSSAYFWGPESTGDDNQDKINKDAHSRYMSFGRQGDIKYDVHIRGLKVKDALIDVPGGFLGGTLKTAAHIGFGIEDAGLSMAKGITEFGGLLTDIGSAVTSDVTGKDLQTEAGKYIDENFPTVKTTGASAFIGTAGQFIGGYKIGEKILQKTLGKKGKAWLAARAAGADAVVGKRISSIGQTTLKYGTPALIGEPLVATSEDMTVLQALSPLTEKFLGFRMAKEMPDPRDPSLSPAQRAKNLLVQKLRFGLEAPLVVGGLSAGFEGLIKFASPHLIWAGSKGKGALGWAYNQGAKVISSQKTGIPQTIRGAKWARKKFGELPGIRRIPSVKDWKLYNPAIQISKNDRVDTGIQKAVGMIDSVLRIVRTNEALTPEAKAIQRQTIQQIEKIKRSVLGKFQLMNNSMHKVADEMTLTGKDLSKWEQKIMQEDLIKYVTNPELKAKNLFRGMNQDFKTAAAGLRREMVTLKRMYNRLGLPFDEASGIMAKNMHEYLASSFKIINDSSYTVAPEAKEAVVNMVKGMLRFDKKLLSEREAIAKQIRSGERTGTIDDAYEQLLNERSLERVNRLINLGTEEKMSTAKLIQSANKELEQIGGIQSLNRLKGGKPLPKLIDRLYGKVDDSQVALTDTIMELADAIVKTRMYDDMARSGQGKWLFDSADGLVKATGALTTLKQIKITGPGYSDIAKSMHNKWTIPAMKDSIENMGPILWTDRLLQVPYLRGFLRTFLQTKALSQVTKTVLSPTTQIRNVTSAANFALAAGHIGNGASFKQAFDYIVKDVFTPNGVFDDKIFKAKMEEYVEQGIVNSNMIVKELEFLVRDATKGRPSIYNTDALFKRLYENKYIEGAVDLYRSGDDIWKIYGYEFEKSLVKPAITNLDDIVKYHKEVLGRTFDVDSFILKAAGYKPNLQDMKYLPNLTDDQIDVAVREIAGEVIKNVYPNYNYVPTLIQNLRRMPYGNFISFPAEMMRTSANIIRYSLNELASTNPVIRQNGARRIMGYSTALTLPFVAAEAAQKLMGVSDRMMNSLQDSFTPSWNQEGPLVVTDVAINNKGQTIVKYVPTGYQFPHVSVIIAPFYKALDAIESGKAAGDTGWRIFTDTMLESLFTVLQPFSGEQILTEAWNDVTTRGGETKQGRRIYYDHDSPVEKLTKKVVHILKAGMTPGAVPQFHKLGNSVYNLFQEDRKDMIYTNQGLPYNFGTEAMSVFSGVREYEVNVHKSFEKYEIGAFARTLESTRAKAGVGIYDENMSPEQIVEAFYNQQLEEYRVFNTFYATYQDAGRWGLSRAEAYKMMEGKTGLTKRDAAMLINGKFNPAGLPNFTAEGRIYEILEGHDYSPAQAADFMRNIAYEMKRIQRDFSAVPLEWTREKVEAFINFKKQKQYEQNIQGQQQSSLQTEQLPITQPQTTAAAPQATPSAVAGSAMAAGPKTVRQRIIEDDPFLKDLA